MKRQPVSSSLLKSVGYDAERRIFELEFQNRRIYQYFDVPPDEHRELMAAPSHGGYFLDAIRDIYTYAHLR
jgi:hypothetical protein